MMNIRSMFWSIILLLLIYYINKCNSYDIENELLLDRTEDVDVKVSFSMDIKYSKEKTYQPNYNEVMTTLYGNSKIFNDDLLDDAFKLVDITTSNAYSPELYLDLMTQLVTDIQPKVIVELGVYRGVTSCFFAALLLHQNITDSFVMSVDTWLLDLRYAWKHEQKEHEYFKMPSIGGGSQFYLQFIKNVIEFEKQYGYAVTTNIIPIQSTTTNAAHIFMNYGWQIDLLYIDASHTRY